MWNKNLSFYWTQRCLMFCLLLRSSWGLFMGAMLSALCQMRMTAVSINLQIIYVTNLYKMCSFIMFSDKGSDISPQSVCIIVFTCFNVIILPSIVGLPSVYNFFFQHLIYLYNFVQITNNYGSWAEKKAEEETALKIMCHRCWASLSRGKSQHVTKSMCERVYCRLLLRDTLWTEQMLCSVWCIYVQ